MALYPKGDYYFDPYDIDSIWRALAKAESNGWQAGAIESAQSYQQQNQYQQQQRQQQKQPIQPQQPQVQHPIIQAYQQGQQRPVELESLPFDEVLEFVKAQGYSCFMRKPDRKGKAVRAQQRAQANYQQLKQGRLNQY